VSTETAESGRDGVKWLLVFSFSMLASAVVIAPIEIPTNLTLTRGDIAVTALMLSAASTLLAVQFLRARRGI
jgi:hypothetical protein